MEFALSLLDKLSGPAGNMVGSLSKLTEWLGKTTEGAGGLEGGLASGGAAFGPYGAAAMAVIGVLTALTAATAGLILEGAKLAIDQSEIREQLVTTFDALGGGAGAGEKTIAMLDKLGATTGQTRTKLADWAQTLESAGTRDLPTLQAQLTAVSSSFALMGTQGQAASEKVVKLLSKVDEAGQLGKKLQLTGKELQGIGVDAGDIAKQLGIPVAKMNAELKAGTRNAKEFGDALTKALTEKGQGPLERFANSFTSIKDRFKEFLGQLFEGVDPSPLLKGLKSITSLFDQNTATGKVMKGAITGIFNTIFSVAGKVLPYIKTGFELMVIAGLKVYIALKPIIRSFEQMGGGGTIIKVLGYIITGTAMAVVALATAFARATAFAFAIGTAIGKAFKSAKGVISGAADAIGDFINGLVSGIESGAGLVMDAIKHLGSSMLNSMKSALGISSPSKEMMKLGKFSAEGFGAGVSHGASRAAAPMKALASGAMGAAGKGAAAGGGGSKSTTVHFHEGAIKIDGAGKSGQEISLEMLSLAFEQLRRAQGL